MSAAASDDWVKAKRADEGDCQMAIHALHGVLETLDWIDSVQVGVSEDRLREGKACLLIAGRLITEDMRQQF